MSKITEILEHYADTVINENQMWLKAGAEDDGYLERQEEHTKEIEAELLASLWTDGPPKDTGEGKFVLVMKNDFDKPYENTWNAAHDRLEMIIDFNGPVIKHMELPSYE